MQYWEESPNNAEQNMWNLSASASLEFKGALVQENSTKILENSTDLPIWDVQSKASKTTSGSRSTSTLKVASAAIKVAVPNCAWTFGLLTPVLMLFARALLF